MTMKTSPITHLKNRNRLASIALIAFAPIASLGLTASAFAVGETWISTSGTNWSTSGNWGPNATLSNSDSVIFGANNGSGVALYNDISGLILSGTSSFNSNAGSYVINGNAITLSGTAYIANNSANTQTINTNLALSGLDVSTSGNIVLGGAISGTRLTVSGGTLTLTGNNTFSNATPTVVSAAATLVMTGNNTGRTSPSMAVYGGVLQLQANTNNTNAGVSSALCAAGGQGLALNPGSTVQLRSDSNVTFAGFDVMTVSSSGNYTFDVNQLTAIGSNKTISINTVGTALNASNATINVTGGNGYTLSVGKMSLANPGSLTLNPTTANMTFGGLREKTVGGAGALVLDGTSTGNVVNGLVYDGTTSAVMSVTKTNSSEWALSYANTYSGTTSVNGGILQITTDTALGSNAAGTIVANGAALKLSNVNYATAEALTINGSGVSSSGALMNNGTSTYAGQITAATNSTINTGGGKLTLTGGLVKNGTVLTLTGGGTVDVNSVGISGASANSDLVVDNVTANLNAANSYNGPTYIRNTATVSANVANALPTANGRSAVIMDDAGTGSSALNLGANQSIGSLTGASTSTVNLNGNTLTVGAGSGSTTFAGSIGGSGSLVKDGQSAQVLSGNSSYSGATQVVAGTLIVNGSLASTGTVSNGATLSGAGTISGAIVDSGSIAGTLGFGNGVTLKSGGTLTGASHTITGALVAESGATIAPGESEGVIGTLTAGSLNLQLGSQMTLDIRGTIAGTNADEVITTADSGLTLGGKLTLEIDASYTAGHSDALFLIRNQGNGLTSTYFSGLTITNSSGSTNYTGSEGTLLNIAGQEFALTYAGGDGNDVALLAVPEPSTWAMILGGMGMLLGIQRLRRQAPHLS